jgi:hypothetical protein
VPFPDADGCLQHLFIESVGKLAILPKGRKAAKDLQEDTPRELFCFFSLIGDTQAKRKDALAVKVVERFKRRFFAPLSARNELKLGSSF